MKLAIMPAASLLFLCFVCAAQEPAVEPAAPPRKILYEFGFGTNADLSAEKASRRGFRVHQGTRGRLGGKKRTFHALVALLALLALKS